MLLHEKIATLLDDNNFTVSEWLIKPTLDGRNVAPPYAVIKDVEGNGIYADGIMVIPIETVHVHFVYRGDKDSEKLAHLDELLKPFGFSWTKESFSAERVMIKTYTLEG